MAKVDASIDEEVSQFSVSEMLKKRDNDRMKMKKAQPWKTTYVVDPQDLSQSNNILEKPWYNVDDLKDSYEGHSGS
jgi:hypothetical protein